MGIIDRIADRVAARIAAQDIEKAALSGIPAANVRDVTALVEAISRGQNVSASNDALSDAFATTLGPGLPFLPQTFDTPDPQTGVVPPRRTDYATNWNLVGGGRPTVPFSVLRDVASVGIVRKAIDIRKGQVSGVDWTFRIKPSVLDAAAMEQGTSKVTVRQNLLTQYKDDIARLTTWWGTPDRKNNMKWESFVRLMLEEVLVTDNLSIYPVRSLGGELLRLRILDSTTIKPLIDKYGDTPEPPYPAYQQILKGFVRNQMEALPESRVDGQYYANQLVHMPFDMRPSSPYGYSAVEKAIYDVETYLLRTGWLRSEYTAGSVGAALLVVRDGQGESFNANPELYRQYTQIFNDSLSGNNTSRHLYKLLFPGVEPVFPQSQAEQYKTELDNHLITLVLAALDVTMDEYGFTPSSGLGGAGHGKARQDTAYRKAIRPMFRYIEGMVDLISSQFLGMPDVVEFAFDLGEEDDATERDARLDAAVKGGRMTLNGARGEAGDPPYEGIPEADEPFIYTPNGPVFLKGLLEQHVAGVAASVAGSEMAAKNPIDPNAPKPDPFAKEGDTPPADAAPADAKDKQPAEGDKMVAATKAAQADELAAFSKFATKRASWGRRRDFDFKTLDEHTAGALNKCAAAGDLKLLEAEITKAGKEPARRRPGAKNADAIRNHYAPTLKTALQQSVDVHALMAYLHTHENDLAIEKAAADDAARAAEARARAEKAVTAFTDLSPTNNDTAALRAVVGALTQDAAGAGMVEADHQVDGSPLEDWEPGWDAGAEMAKNLPDLLSQVDVRIAGMNQESLARITDALSTAIANGTPVTSLAGELRDLVGSDYRALLIAETETNRVMTQASRHQYIDMGVEYIGYGRTDDYMNCDCPDNEDASPIGVLDEWPGGDPPVHPNCGCYLYPVSQGDAEYPGDESDVQSTDTGDGS